MTGSFPQGLSARTFQIHFQPQDWKEGQLLQHKGAVLSCRPLPSERTVTGVVREGMDELRVGLTLNPMQFRGTCTCWQKSKTHHTCKHMVALLLHWFDPPQRQTSGLSSADEAYLQRIGQGWQASGVLHEANLIKLQVLASRNPTAVQDHLKQQGWGKLWDVLQAKGGVAPAGSASVKADSSAAVPAGLPLDRQLVFVLDLGTTEPLLTPPRVQPHLGFIQQGKLLNPQKYLPGRTAYLPMQQESQLLKAVLDARADQHLHHKSPLGKVLEQLLQQGLLYLQGQWERPMRLGPDRMGMGGWIFDSEGVQRPQFEVSPTGRLLLLDEVWFVDAGKLEAGRVSTPHAAAEIELFLRWPAVPPEEVLEAQRGLEPFSPPLPFPSVVPVVQQASPPEFRVVLQGRRAGLNRDAVVLPELRLSVLYSGVQVLGKSVLQTGNPESTLPLRRFEEGTLFWMNRDLHSEKAAVDFLQGSGLTSHPHGFETVFRPAGQDVEGPLQHLLSTLIPEMHQRGWQVQVESSFPGKVIKGEVECRVQEEQGWFSLELGVEVSGETVSLLPLLLQWMQTHPDLLQVLLTDASCEQVEFFPVGEGRFVPVGLHRLKSLMRLLLEFYQSGPLDGPLRIPRMAAALVLEGDPEVRWAGEEDLFLLAGKLRQLQEPTPREAPAGLQAQLRSYQQEGVGWLQSLRETGLGGVLADDMGLGKTLQTLTHLLIEKEAGRLQKPALVVAPTSLMGNWVAEARKFTPELNTLVLHGNSRHQHFVKIGEADVVFTTYSLLIRDLAELQQHAYHLIILDEAQHIKNPPSKASQALKQLHATHRLCLTGTPIENHLGELWSLFRFLNPGLLPAEAEFRQLFRDPIEKTGDALMQERLSRLLKPLMLRRTKGEVARELPGKTERVVRLELQGEQRDAYEALRVATQDRLKLEIEQRGLARSQIHVLTALLKLRQLCCHPPLVHFEEARKVRGSVKLEWFKETLPEMLGRGQRVLVFSQFTSLLGVLEETLTGMGVPYALLTGQTADREGQVGRFQSGEVAVFLISLKAGGVGLNLTAADTVIHFDPWWNPAAENQATDRAYRIGQDKPVFVYKLVTEGTIEEKILALQEKKARLAHSVLHGGEGQQFNADDVAMLLGN